MKLTKISTQSILLCFPLTGGLELSVRNANSRLVKSGIQCEVVCTNYDSHRRAYLSKTEKIDGIGVMRKEEKSFKFYPFTLQLDYFNPNNIIIFEDFLTFPDIFITFFVTILKILHVKHCKLLFVSRGLWSRTTRSSPGIYFRLQKLVNETIGVFFLNCSLTAVRAVSKLEARNLKNSGIKVPIHVIHNGLETIALSKDIQSKVSKEVLNSAASYGRYLLQIGTVNRVKNFEAVIQTLPLLPNDIKFIIMGGIENVSYKCELEKQAADLGVSDRLVFIGTIKGFDKYYLLSQATVYVHMSHTEGFCTAVLEAKSQGAVCVINSGTAMSELIKDGINGFEISAYNTLELADKIKYIINNIESREIQLMKQTNIIESRDFTIDRTVSELKELFQRITK